MYNTEGTVCNNLEDPVLYFDSSNYNGTESPVLPYPRKLGPKKAENFQQVEDDTNTTSAAVVYRAKNSAQSDVNIIIAWKNSPAEKRAFTKITDTTGQIDWTDIKKELDQSKDNDKDERLGLKSTITWNPSSLKLEATFSG